MGELWFVIKSFGLAMLILAGLQFKIGDETLEAKSIRWIETSAIGDHLRDVADGAIKVSKKAWEQASAAMGLKSDQTIGFKEWEVEFKHKSENKAKR